MLSGQLIASVWSSGEHIVTSLHKAVHAANRIRILANAVNVSRFIVAALWNRTGHYIFAPWFLSSLVSFFPRLISAVAEWMSTILRHMMWS